MKCFMSSYDFVWYSVVNKGCLLPVCVCCGSMVSLTCLLIDLGKECGLETNEVCAIVQNLMIHRGHNMHRLKWPHFQHH